MWFECFGSTINTETFTLLETGETYTIKAKKKKKKKKEIPIYVLLN